MPSGNSLDGTDVVVAQRVANKELGGISAQHTVCELDLVVRWPKKIDKKNLTNFKKVAASSFYFIFTNRHCPLSFSTK
jgi:hypothetical protein